LPQENIRIEMNEGAVLQAVGKQLSQSPPARLDVSELLELSRDMRKWQAQTIHQQSLARSIRNQYGLRIVLGSQPVGQAPGEQVVDWLAPDASLEGAERLAPERPDCAHKRLLGDYRPA